MIGIFLLVVLAAVNGYFGLKGHLFNMWVCGWCAAFAFVCIVNWIRDES